MTYLVDGSAVNSRTDWRHSFLPTVQPRQEESFPGLAERISIQGPKLPEDLVIVGYLEGTGASLAAAATALMQAVRTQGRLRNDGVVHTVRVHNLLISQMELLDFNTLAPVEPIQVSGSFKVRQAVRYAWRELVESAEVVS